MYLHKSFFDSIIRSTKTGPRTNRKFLFQPCSNGSKLPQEEQQLSSFIDLAKKNCKIKNKVGLNTLVQTKPDLLAWIKICHYVYTQSLIQSLKFYLL